MLNKIIYRCTLVCLLAFHLFQFSYAQSNAISFTTINTKQGLSSNTVNSIIKDRYGLMWFATDDGLNKFDGTSFSIYRHNSGDSTSIPSNRITVICEDKNGTLWIGTEDGYLSAFDRKKNNFKTLFHLNSRINAVVEIDGKIWVGNYGGITVIDPLTKTKFTFPAQARGESRIQSGVNAVFSIYKDNRHRIWVGTRNGLVQYDRKREKFVLHQFNSGEPAGLPGAVAKVIIQDSSGRLWIGTNRGLSVIVAAGNRSNFPRNPSFRANNNIYALGAGKDGKIWIGTEDGLNILDPKTGIITSYFSDIRNINSISSNSIRSIYIDKKSDIYWVGSYQGGVNKYDRNLALFNLKQSNPFDERGLVSSRVTSFAASNPNELYVATDGGGLQLYDRRTGLFSRIKLPLSASKLMALESSRNKDLWIGSYSQGLFLLNSDSRKFSHFKKGVRPADLTNNDIFCIKEDRNGKVWIGTNGGGLNVYNPLTKTFVKYSAEIDKQSKFHLPINNFIREIVEDQSGKIWIGSHGSGIAVFDPITDRFLRKYSTSDSLSNNVVVSMLCDRENNIWVGTAGGGLNLLDRKTNRFKVLSETDGLASDMIYKIIEENGKRLWLSTNAGISSFDIETKKFVNYNRFNGVQNNTFLRGSGLRLPDGEIFFGGLEGFNYFNPSDLKRNKNIPFILFTDLKVENESVSPNGTILNDHISVAKQVYLDYKQSFSLSFAGVSYTAPQQNLYSYKLDGFNKNWSKPSASRTVTYTNLDPGTYIFRVKVANNDGVWNDHDASISIIVKPPFWRTVYAYFFYLVFILGSLYYLRRRTLNRLEARFALQQERSRVAHVLEQERKEAERVRELDNLKIKFLTNLSHEFRTPISLIMGPIDNLIALESNERKSNHLNMVKRNARRLLNLVNQLLDFRKMEEHELKLNPAEGDVISFIKEVTDSFSDLSERKNVAFSFISTVPSLLTSFDHDKIERILFNLLSNAFKFTMPKGEIKLQIDQAEDSSDSSKAWLRIQVSDTGIGISEDKIEKIFERFFQSSTTAAILNQGSGIGLSITQEFVKMMGGSINVESESGKGATFIIRLPFSPIAKPETFRPDNIPVNDCFTSQEVKIVTEAEEPDVEHLRLYNHDEIITVLLIEDNEDFRFYLKDNLKGYYRVLEASNGKEGWQKALAGHPHLIVSDVNMPLMDGIELSRKIRSDKRTSHIPIILLTALAAEEEQIKGLGTGANDYMTKPFNFEILIAKIKNLIVLNRTLKDTYTKQFKMVTPEIEIESEDAKLITRVLLYIEQNINDPKLSVEDLSKSIGMSRSTLYNKIMEITGQSPVEYIRNVKLDKAALLLEKSALPIAHVGYTTGFATPNYFAKSFKARFGMLPSEYASSKRNITDSKV